MFHNLDMETLSKLNLISVYLVKSRKFPKNTEHQNNPLITRSALKRLQGDILFWAQAILAIIFSSF